MSIIAALIDLDGNKIPVSVIDEIKNAAFYFPGDTQNIWHQHQAVLCQNLVYNTPEALHEQLPYKDPESNLVICTNCRIDNRKELSAKLNIPDHHSVPDSTFIISAYKKYGNDFIKHLLGSFAIVIWDQKKKEVYIARDHLGQSPLYYYFKKNLLVVASTVRQILACPEVDDQIDHDFFINYATQAPQEEDTTFYQYIKEVLPRTYLRISDKGVSQYQYWDLDINKRTHFKNDEDYVDQFKELFSKSVEARVRSYRNVGAELSGGIDSGGVVAYAQKSLKRTGRELYTYSRLMRPEDVGKIFPFKDESQLINDICSFCGITQKFSITENLENNLIDGLDRAIEETGGLDNYMVGHREPIRTLAKSHGVGTLLSGFPGDELVSSFCKSYYLEYLQRGDYIKYLKEVRKIKKFRSGLLRLLYNHSYKRAPRLTMSGHKALLSLWQPGTAREAAKIKSLFKESYVSQNREVHGRLYNIPISKPAFSLREAQKSHLLRSHTSKRMSMENRYGHFHKIESRHPMADVKLAEYVLSVPFEQKISEKSTRWLYRRSIVGSLPDHVVWRDEKWGAVMPYSQADYNNLLPQRLAWFDEIENKAFALPFDIPRWKEKAITLSKRERGDSIVHAAGRQNTLAFILRYLQTKKYQF